jgi:hypothetical protein
MATLRPLFVNFFSRSRLLGSSTREASAGWGPRSASRKGYFRSGGGRDNNGPEELGLSGLPKGSGVSTTIHSMNDIRSSEERAEREQAEKGAPSPRENIVDDTIKRIQKFGSGRREGSQSLSTKGLKGPSGTWNSNESHLAEDSSSEDTTAPSEPPKGIEVRRTTEVSVTSTSEWRGPRSRTPNGIGSTVSRDLLH